jgi:hypothetical protein
MQCLALTQGLPEKKGTMVSPVRQTQAMQDDSPSSSLSNYERWLTLGVRPEMAMLLSKSVPGMGR